MSEPEGVCVGEILETGEPFETVDWDFRFYREDGLDWIGARFGLYHADVEITFDLEGAEEFRDRLDEVIEVAREEGRS